MRLLAIALCLPALASAQEVRVTFVAATGPSVSVSIPMPSDAAALAASSALRFWAPSNSDIRAATILAVDAQGVPLAPTEEANQ